MHQWAIARVNDTYACVRIIFEIKLSRCGGEHTLKRHIASAEGTPISKRTDVLFFWVNKIRFRKKNAVREQCALGRYSRVRGVAMLVGFVDRRYLLRSVAKTDHSVSTIFYWHTLDLLYNKHLIRLARAESDERERTRKTKSPNESRCELLLSQW